MRAPGRATTLALVLFLVGGVLAVLLVAAGDRDGGRPGVPTTSGAVAV